MAIEMTSAVAYVKGAAYISAAIAIGFGVLGPSIGQGMIGAAACKKIGEFPENAREIRAVMLLAMGLTESGAVYTLIIALFILSLVYSL